MSVLSNTTIRDYLYSGRITIDPPPQFSEEGDNSPYDACSVQLHMDNKIQEPAPGLKLAFDLSQPGKKLNETIDSVCNEIVIPRTGYVLDPGNFILAQTREEIGFPQHGGGKALAGRIEGRSSFARTGLLVHFTAPTIHYGYKGTITLELLNHGPMPLILKPGLAICQLIIETVRGLPAIDFPSQFQGQQKPSGTS